MASQARLKSSFIYLANAVNDLRGNWTVLALVLVPLVLAASLCLLPDAINLQYGLARRFAPGATSVEYTPAEYRPVQEPYRPAAPHDDRLPVAPWVVTTLHVLSIAITVLVSLVVLCALERIQRGVREPGVIGEALAVFKRSIELLPAFIWILFLEALAILVGLVLLIIPGVLAFIWLYFSQYALIFEQRRSWPALLYSRDLMRGRFFKVAIRIVVFLAVWSGFNSWAGGLFVVMSLIVGPVGILTGSVGTLIFLLDLMAVAVAYATIAFFIAAGVRLYQDLRSFINQEAALAREMAPLKTAALSQANA
ncbi:MAG: hypothetical protein ACREP6_01635 [Candidatus Binataceae bacterium]